MVDLTRYIQRFWLKKKLSSNVYIGLSQTFEIQLKAKMQILNHLTICIVKKRGKWCHSFTRTKKKLICFTTLVLFRCARISFSISFIIIISVDRYTSMNKHQCILVGTMWLLIMKTENVFLFLQNWIYTGELYMCGIWNISFLF